MIKLLTFLFVFAPAFSENSSYKYKLAESNYSDWDSHSDENQETPEITEPEITGEEQAVYEVSHYQGSKPAEYKVIILYRNGEPVHVSNHPATLNLKWRLCLDSFKIQEENQE